MDIPADYPRRVVHFEDAEYAYSALLVADGDELIPCLDGADPADDAPEPALVGRDVVGVLARALGLLAGVLGKIR